MQTMTSLGRSVTVYNLGSVSRLPLGEGRVFQVGNTAVVIFRARGGEVFATQSSCPHKGGPLADGLIGAGKVICPLHAHKFDLQTGAGSEAHECVKTFSVEERNGEIYLSLSK